ncbi:hypothetical protein NliqN6_3136 [Naganishia liquefaciens]|uniref:Protein BTN n=1 Tax=Naganishia liquefaciens TaxID=104408 RepID=A0A8H3TV62_9TREE|nr:hypothetical protein NliqN6_3136 [Naganishia liquefaciens]
MAAHSATRPQHRDRDDTYHLADMRGTHRRGSSSSSSGDIDVARPGLRIAGQEYADDDVDAFIAENERFQHGDGDRPRHPRARLIASFFLFGVLNNILYVIILSAALDLVPPSTPKGLVAFFNIFPSLTTKLLWPYLVPGNPRYKRRILVCTAASWSGMVLIATVNSTALRLLGIGMASFSSGFGEMTFLQLSTTLPAAARLSRDALSAWSSGTGGAGIGGAALWWILRALGVRRGLGLASFLPFAFPAVFWLLLPRFPAGDDAAAADDARSGHPIFAVDVGEDEVSLHSDQDGHGARKVFISHAPRAQVVLTAQEKLTLVKPMLLRYMLPLFLVFAFEYIINAGVAPTLAFPPPRTGIWKHVFNTIRDYYPFWSLTYQTFVFLSRSSLSLGMRPIPRRLLFLPAALQGIILTLLALQASHYIFSSPNARPHRASAGEPLAWWSRVLGWLIGSGGGSNDGAMNMSSRTHVTDRAISVVFLLICLEGLMGGLGYCHTFYHIGHEGEDEDDVVQEYSRIAQAGDDHETAETLASDVLARRKTVKEFRMGAAGAADSLGIVLATLIAMPVEISLCKAQVKAGSTICKEL